MMSRSIALRILYDQPLPNGFAASIQILKTAAAFATRGHDVRVYHPGTPVDLKQLSDFYGEAWPDSMTFVPAKHNHWLDRWRTIYDINRACRTYPATALLGRGPAIQSLLTARRLSRKVIRLYEMHNIQWLRYAQKSPSNAGNPSHIAQLKNGEMRTIQTVDGLICVTKAVEEAAADLAGTLPPTAVLPSGTDLPQITPNTCKTVDVAYAGKIEARKGIDLLVEAMVHLPRCRLAIAGGPKPEIPELRRRIHTSNLSSRIEVIGVIPAQAVSDFLCSARVGVCPLPKGYDAVSDRFTSPVKLLQMLSLGMAVVATDTAPVRAIARHGHDAWLVAPNDPKALAEGIQTLLNDPSLASRLGREAKRTAVRYSWSSRAENLERFIYSLSESGG